MPGSLEKLYGLLHLMLTITLGVVTLLSSILQIPVPLQNQNVKPGNTTFNSDTS